MNNRIRWYQIRRVMAVVLIVTLLPFSNFAANGVCVQAAPVTPDENSLGQEVSDNAVVEENVTPNNVASDTVAFENAVPQGETLEISEPLTLEEDWYITEEVMLKDGANIDLNGYTMTVSNNLIHAGGTLNVGGGTLIVDGNYYKQSREQQADGTWVYGSSTGQLNMHDAEDYVLIGGNFYDNTEEGHWTSCSKGCLELKGHYIQADGVLQALCGGKEHILLLSGGEKQVIHFANPQNPDDSYKRSYFGSIKVTNISEEGVLIEGEHRAYGTFESERESCIEGVLYSAPDELIENGYYGGDVEFIHSETLQTPFEFGKDVYFSLGLYIRSDIKIKGDLYISGYLYQYGKLTIGGNVYFSDGDNGEARIYTYESYTYIKGDVIAETQKTGLSTGIGVNHKNAYVLIEGDYRVSAPNNTGGYYFYGGHGTLEVKGDVEFATDVQFGEGGRLVLSGDEEQRVQVTKDSKFYLIDIQNQSEGGVHFDSYINYEQITLTGNAYYQDAPMLSAYTLTEDTVIDGDVVLCGDVMSLNGHTLTVKGDLIQLGARMQIDGGELLVEGNYYIGEPDGMWEDELATYSNGCLYMTGVQDRVTVYGDMYMAKKCSDTGHQYHLVCESVLKAGTLEVKGDMVVRDQEYGYSSFETEANTPFTLILSGDSKQKVWFDAEVSTTQINHLTITNTSEDGIEFVGNPKVIGTIATNQDNKIEGGIRIKDITQLSNGYYAGDIYNDNYLYINQDVEIGGNLLNEGELCMQNETVTLLVNGNFTNNSSKAVMEKGTLELKGEFTDTTEITYDPAHRILFSGDERQTISSTATLGTIELQNPAGVYSERAFKFAKLITNGYRLIVADEEGIMGYTLTSDETIIGDLYLTIGVMDLNGYTLTVKGDVILQEGTIDINGGTLIVEGDYRQQFRNRTEEGFTYTESEGLLVMSEDEDKLQIMGDMILSPKSEELVGMENGTVILNGTEKQTVSAENPFTIKADLQIVNTSLQGVALEADITAEGQVSDLQYKTGGSGCVLISDFGQLENGRFGGNVELVADCYLEQNVTIHGDLTLSKTLYVETYKVSVDGNLYTTGAGKLAMDETEAYVFVKGNVEYATATSSSKCRFADGTMEVKGNYTDPNYTDADENHTLLLSGESLQTVTCNAYLGTLELNNHSEEGVYSSSPIQIKDLILNDCKLVIGDGNAISGFKLEEDYVTDGNVVLLEDTLDLNGYTLTVKGDLILQEGLLKVNNGTLIVEGDLYTYAKYRSQYGGYAYGCLVMEHTGDLVKIGGDWIMNHETTCDCVINNGIIELQGDLRRTDSYKYNYDIGCTLILNGTEKQTVDYPGLQVKELIVKNNNGEGVELVHDVTVTEKVTDENNKLTGKNICITDFAVVEGFEGNVTWTEDLTLTSDVRFGGNLTINGTLDVGHASLVVEGDMTISTRANWSWMKQMPMCW